MPLCTSIKASSWGVETIIDPSTLISCWLTFKSDKISQAIKKAFLAQTKIRNNKDQDKEQKESVHNTVDALTAKIVSALTRRIADGDMIHIEDIQDQVELALMRDEHHKVARAYVLYREQRAASRYHTKKLKEQVGEKASSMMVTKRDGSKSRFHWIK